MIDAPAASPAVKYKRIVLKLSGEVLRGHSTDPIDPAVLERICSQIKEIHELGVQVGVVIGGGNIFRGLSGEQKGVDRTTGDYMGMLATVINSLALMDCLEKMGVTTRVQSAIPMNQVAEPFILRRAIRHVEKGRVVIFAAGGRVDRELLVQAAVVVPGLVLGLWAGDRVHRRLPAERFRSMVLGLMVLTALAAVLAALR